MNKYVKNLICKVLPVLQEQGVSFNLVDIGASGDVYPPFRPVLPVSTLLGFDADSREIRVDREEFGGRVIILNKAITSEPSRDEVCFYLTKSPYCSSTLRPLAENLSVWPYAGLFEVIETRLAASTTIEKALAAAGLSHFDWIKVDTQGTDLRILQSLGGRHLDRMLVCDVEPGLYHHYEASDLFGSLHDFMVENGFWLAELAIQNQPRISQIRYSELMDHLESDRLRALMSASMKRSPTATELRYLRTVRSARKLDYGEEEWLRLWFLAVSTENLEFAYEVACEIELKRGLDRWGFSPQEITLETMKSRARGWPYSPKGILSHLKQLKHRWTRR